MIVIAEAMWPPDQSTEMGKAFLEAEPLPDYIEMQGPYTNSFIGEGIRSVVIYKFDAAKYEDAHKSIGKRYVTFSQVPGFTYEFRRWGETEEALEMIGLA